jgi:AcrR family transcriptional regulator
MPRNRRPQDREEKRDEIVIAAAALFTENGYEETSMAKVAATAGVTPNTIYWYFQDKDRLLVGALDHVLAQALSEGAERGEEPWGELVLWAIEQLERRHRLVTAVHGRAGVSPAIDAWHTSFHTLMDSIMADGLRGIGVPEADLTAMTRIGVFVIEGLLMHPHTPLERQQIVGLLTSPR